MRNDAEHTCVECYGYAKTTCDGCQQPLCGDCNASLNGDHGDQGDGLCYGCRDKRGEL